MTLGEILTDLRRERNMSQKELALYLNVSVGTISNYENNVHSPSLETLCRLAVCFGVTVDYLLGRTRYRFDPQLLNRRLSREYTVTDVINTVLTLDTNSVETLMKYASFLQSKS